MRLLKIKIGRERVNNATKYTYPQPHYDMLSIIFGPIYEGGRTENCPEIWARATKDKGDEFILVGVTDNLQLVEALKNPNIKEALRTDFIIEGHKWMGQEEKITDQRKVTLILAKIGRGEVLTITDKNALDPNHPEIGINKTKTFEERLVAIEANNP